MYILYGKCLLLFTHNERACTGQLAARFVVIVIIIVVELFFVPSGGFRNRHVLTDYHHCNLGSQRVHSLESRLFMPGRHWASPGPTVGQVTVGRVTGLPQP